MGRQIRRKEREMLPKRKDTIAYVIDENKPEHTQRRADCHIVRWWRC